MWWMSLASDGGRELVSRMNKPSSAGYSHMSEVEVAFSPTPISADEEDEDDIAGRCSTTASCELPI